MWADLCENTTAADITGRTDTKHNSKLVTLLQDTFRCRIDVPCGAGSHALMRYVAGYVAKASDALRFYGSTTQDDNSAWRQTYRLLSKKSPLEQEMMLEFAGLQMCRHSFTGLALYAPIPGSTAVNSSRDYYIAFQQELRQGNWNGNYMSWLRVHDVQLIGTRQKPGGYRVTQRNSRGRGGGKDCAVAIAFPFELLDIYIGSWAAACLDNMVEQRLMPEENVEGYPANRQVEAARRNSFTAPDNCKHLKAVLCLDEFQTRSSLANL